MDKENNVSERTRRLAEKFCALNKKGESGVPLAWYAWPHDESEEGIVMSVTGDKNIAMDTANIISLYGIVRTDEKVVIFEHEPNHAWPHGFFTVCVDSKNINDAALDAALSIPDKNHPPPHP